MALNNLQEVPQNERDWDIFTLALRVELTKIRQAIQAQKGITLNEYIVDPISPQFTQDFFNNNSRMHLDMNQVLGLQSQDLTSVDIENKEQLSEWVSNNYQEIYSAQSALGV